jgi:hypothetical protein
MKCQFFLLSSVGETLPRVVSAPMSLVLQLLVAPFIILERANPSTMPSHRQTLCPTLYCSTTCSRLQSLSHLLLLASVPYAITAFQLHVSSSQMTIFLEFPLLHLPCLALLWICPIGQFRNSMTSHPPPGSRQILTE